MIDIFGLVLDLFSLDTLLFIFILFFRHGFV